MSLSLGRQLQIRSMVYVAGEPIPYFWPMRSFIHHNPLHGLEEHNFLEAAMHGEQLFHARAFLPRAHYQEHLQTGGIDRKVLAAEVDRFVREQQALPGIDLQRWLLALLTEAGALRAPRVTLADAGDVAATLHGAALGDRGAATIIDTIRAYLRHEFQADRPLYESLDVLYGTDIGEQLDEQVIRICLDFFDEGQSVWEMPAREQGLFTAWRELACRNFGFFRRQRHIRDILLANDQPESVIVHVMETLRVPEGEWIGYFTRELARLHGWSGFVRWRESAEHYHWQQRYPGELVQLLAIRLTLSLALLREQAPSPGQYTRERLEHAIENRTLEVFLRHELYSGRILPEMAHVVEQTLAVADDAAVRLLGADYLSRKRLDEAGAAAIYLGKLAGIADGTAALEHLDSDGIDALLRTLRAFERQEGMLWLRTVESCATNRLIAGITMAEAPEREKRPFVQALFCIDTRSERIRRHLEAVGDYQTYGIAGFFGVPVSFMELGKGSEIHLCPVLLEPKNLVMEMSREETSRDEAALTMLEKAMHELKESVLTPFVTVEAIGLLFGFDMVGKTLMPRTYNRWRQHLHRQKPPTHLLLDKLSREQADSIVRALQRAVIFTAMEQELDLQPEDITDDIIRDLREYALGHQDDCAATRNGLAVDDETLQKFVERLRSKYRITPSFARVQLERLARIGFSLDEQTTFVQQALLAIGLTRQFSRFVLLVGHGSTSENNPYESALDCGACGGNHGLVSARVLAYMANKPQVRDRLKRKGLQIGDDVWFVPALHNTTTDELILHDLDLLPSTHLIYLDRLRSGLTAASRLCAFERLPKLKIETHVDKPVKAFHAAQRNAMDWSQVRPEWGLSGNAFFVIGRRDLTRSANLDGRAFLHSYDYRVDRKRRLLCNILSGPLVVGQWINMEHYFSTVDNQRFGSGSKVYHNVAGRFGVMSGNLSDLRTGLPAQTVLDKQKPYHEPLRLITLIQAPWKHATRAVNEVAAVKRLVRNGWIRLVVADPETGRVHVLGDDEWTTDTVPDPVASQATA